MLCPKCGFITFDKLDTCPKCRKDWAGITEKISGTSSSTDSFCFLGKVIGKEQETAESPYSGDVQIEKESPAAAVEDDLDLSLDGLPKIDLSGIEEEVSTKEAGGEFDLDFDDEAEQDLAAEPSPAEPPEPPVLQKTGEAMAGKKGADLNDIDLSDLVTQEEGGGPVAGMSDTLDMDLSSLEIGTKASDSASMTLDLDGEAEADFLSLDLEPETKAPSKKKSDDAIPDLGLSLDLDE